MDTPRPSATAHHLIDAGNGDSHEIANAIDEPKKDAEDSADQRQRRRFHEKLNQDVMPARAGRFSNADLARSLGDRDQHDIHDDDSADDQRDRCNADRYRKKRTADIGPDLKKIIVCIEREIVLRVVAQVPPRAQRQTDLAFRGRQVFFVQRFGVDRSPIDARHTSSGAA